MTTGTRTTGLPWNSLPTTPNTKIWQLYKYRTWNGTDGRYEMVSGHRRMKWNNYTTSVTVTRMFPSAHVNYNYYGGADAMPTAAQSNAAWTNNDELKLLSRLTDQVKNNEFNLAVFLAEGEQTYSLILNTIKTLYLTTKHLKRGDANAAVRTLFANRPSYKPRKISTKTPADRWLELQYGWKPLLADVKAACDLWEQSTTAPRVMRYVASNKGKPTSYDPAASPSMYGPGGNKGLVSKSKRIVYEAREVMSQPRRLGLYDPLTVFWEVTPFSFVADWFIPIGTYLEVLNLIPSLQGRFITTSKTVYDASLSGSTNLYYKNCITIHKRVDLTRSVSSSLSVPRPTFKPLSKALSPLHLANSIALLRGGLSSLGKPTPGLTISRGHGHTGKVWNHKPLKEV